MLPKMTFRQGFGIDPEEANQRSKPGQPLASPPPSSSCNWRPGDIEGRTPQFFHWFRVKEGTNVLGIPVSAGTEAEETKHAGTSSSSSIITALVPDGIR